MRGEHEREERERKETKPETDGGRALRMTVSGDTEVSAGETLRLRCEAQFTLNPPVRFISEIISYYNNLGRHQ